MPLKTFQDETPSLNLTAMIDVVFQLVLFLMVGTKFEEMERNINVNVPEVRDNGTLAATEDPAKKIVNVERLGRITIDQRQVTLEQLQAELANVARQYPDIEVIVRGDGGCNYQQVATVFNACRLAGVRKMAASVMLDEHSR